MHLSGAISNLPHGLVFLSLADNGITSKGRYLKYVETWVWNILQGTLLRFTSAYTT